MKFRHLVLASMAIASLAACVGDGVDSSVARHDYAESKAVKHKRADAALNVRDIKGNEELMSKTLAMKTATLGGDPVEMANLVRDYKDLLEKDSSYGDSASNAAYQDLKAACDKDELCVAEVIEPGAADRIREERKKAEEEKKKEEEGKKIEPSSKSIRKATSSSVPAPSEKKTAVAKPGHLDGSLNDELRLAMTYDLLPPSNLVLELQKKLNPGESVGREAGDNAYVNLPGQAAFLGLARRDGRFELIRTDFLKGHMSDLSDFDARLGAVATYRGQAFLPDLTGSEAISRRGKLTYTIETSQRRGSGSITGLALSDSRGVLGVDDAIVLGPAIFGPTAIAQVHGLASGSENGEVIAAKGEAVGPGGPANKHPYVMTISNDGRAIAGAIRQLEPNPILMYGEKQQ